VNHISKLILLSWRRKGHVLIAFIFLIINSVLTCILPMVIGSMFDSVSN